MLLHRFVQSAGQEEDRGPRVNGVSIPRRICKDVSVKGSNDVLRDLPSDSNLFHSSRRIQPEMGSNDLDVVTTNERPGSLEENTYCNTDKPHFDKGL